MQSSIDLIRSIIEMNYVITHRYRVITRFYGPSPNYITLAKLHFAGLLFDNLSKLQYNKEESLIIINSRSISTINVLCTLQWTKEMLTSDVERSLYQ